MLRSYVTVFTYVQKKQHHFCRVSNRMKNISEMIIEYGIVEYVTDSCSINLMKYAHIVTDGSNGINGCPVLADIHSIKDGEQE